MFMAGKPGARRVVPMKSRCVFMPHAEHRVSRRRAAAALLPALALAASPAAAERTRARLAVHATVHPSCLFSTDPAGAAAVSCTRGSGWNISVEWPGADPVADRRNAALPRSGDAAPPRTVVTVSY